MRENTLLELSPELEALRTRPTAATVCTLEVPCAISLVKEHEKPHYKQNDLRSQNAIENLSETSILFVVALRQTVGASARTAATRRPSAVELELEPRLGRLGRADRRHWSRGAAIRALGVEIL
nr:hypothetical protein CFP56_33782 [Quercus suber]